MQIAWGKHCVVPGVSQTVSDLTQVSITEPRAQKTDIHKHPQPRYQSTALLVTHCSWQARKADTYWLQKADTFCLQKADIFFYLKADFFIDWLSVWFIKKILTNGLQNYQVTAFIPS
jgi:hypothetical protein